MSKQIDNIENKAFITISHDVKLDADYSDWFGDLKNRYQRAQIKAAIKVNSEKLLWNWQLGRDLVLRKAEEHWGAGVVEQLSLDLKAAFPNEKGFGALNLWMMKRWYLFYTEKINKEVNPERLYQLGKELYSTDNQKRIKLHQLGKEIQEHTDEGLPFPEIFAFIPWRHHVEIITNCNSIEEALYYIHRTIDEGLSRNNLLNCLKADLFHKQGGSISNFSDHLPVMQAQLAQEITKENYDFGFITLPPKYDELQLEEALAQQLTRFLLELGTGFAFVGRQKEIVVAGKTRRIDMLFYHIHLRAYVVCELKAVAFEPEFAGKLNFYVNAVNKLLKTKNDNPTIGLLICSNLNETEVQWSFEGISSPIGVASYGNVNIADIKKQLPSVEELENRIKMLEEELKKG